MHTLSHLNCFLKRIHTPSTYHFQPSCRDSQITFYYIINFKSVILLPKSSLCVSEAPQAHSFTQSLRPKSWFEGLLLKGYVTWPTKHTADKGRTTTLNHAIKREIKIQSTSGIQPRMLLVCFSIEAVFLPVGCLRALAVPTGLFTPLSILTLIWSNLILHDCFSTSSFASATSVVGLCYFCSCEC